MVTGVGLVFFLAPVAAAQLVVPIINLTGLFVWLWEWGWFGRVEQAGVLSFLAVLLAAHGVAWWAVPWRGQSASKSDAVGAGLSLLAVVTWSRGYVAYPAALEHIPPFALAGSVELAMLIAALMFVAAPWGRPTSPSVWCGGCGRGVCDLGLCPYPGFRSGAVVHVDPDGGGHHRLWLRTPGGKTWWPSSASPWPTAFT